MVGVLTLVCRHPRLSASEQTDTGKAKTMSEVRATAMATKIANELNITREAAFDAILAVATELEISGTRYSEKQASEIELIVIRDAAAGALPAIQRQAIGA